MKETFVTLVGMNYYYGSHFIKPGLKLLAVKEPNNKFDSDAIRIEHKDIGKIGYVANTPYTRAKGTLSASRVYGELRNNTIIEVAFTTDKAVICKVIEKKKAKKKYKALEVV